jgi:hypothetical protein
VADNTRTRPSLPSRRLLCDMCARVSLLVCVYRAQVVPHNESTVDVVFTKQAFKQVYANPDWPVLSSNASEARVLSALPYSSSAILSFDVSCQSGHTEVRVPAASVLGGNGYIHSLAGPKVILTGVSEQSSVAIDLSRSAAATVPRLNMLEAHLLSGWAVCPPVCLSCWGTV